MFEEWKATLREALLGNFGRGGLAITNTPWKLHRPNELYQ
jgi:hypothetical protein